MKAILYQAKCLFGFTSCSLCGLLPLRESVSTRIIYTFLLLLCLILAIIALEGSPLPISVMQFLNNTCNQVHSSFPCNIGNGFFSVYRVCFAFFIFHIIWCLMTSWVTHSSQFAAKLHNGFWFWKFLFIFILLFVLFKFVPHELQMVYKVMNFIGMASSFILILIQQITIIDGAYEINGYMRAKAERNCCFIILLAFIVTGVYLIVVTAFLLMAFFYAYPRVCLNNRIFIGINAGLVVIISLASFLSKMKNRVFPILPAGVTSLYVAFLTWSAISNQPGISVNNETDISQLNGWEKRLVTFRANGSLIYCNIPVQIHGEYFNYEISAYIGLLITSVMIIYSSVKTSMAYRQVGIKKKYPKKKCRSCDELEATAPSLPLTVDESIGGEMIIEQELMRPPAPVCGDAHWPRNDYVISDDALGAHYSYPWFHFVFGLANMYIMVQLTNWLEPQNSHIRTIGQTNQAFYIKLISSWLVMGLYAWSLVCPGFCIGRDLSQFHMDTLQRNRASLLRSRQKQKSKKQNL